MDVELCVTGTTTRDPHGIPGVEPCERCGTRIMLIDMPLVVRDFVALYTGQWAREQPGDAACSWYELHGWEAPAPDGVEQRFMWRAHTPDRCTRARAGAPEPVDFTLDDDDDDDDE